ncbi:MAG: hypothetical protein CEE42_14950 [Promethearchaeota archaeon Loki_b31]|nr:MAG: hypothetical protein CEE42_14950 [Candidatus Lokiarchaeota archaeon Loki_b31]
MEFLEHLNLQFNDLIDIRCFEQNVGNFSLGEEIRESSIIIKIERLSQLPGKKCDCIVISFLRDKNKIAISVIELKSGSYKFSIAKDQIEDCIQFLKDNVLLGENLNYFKKYQWDFFPIIVHKSSSKQNNRAVLSPANRVSLIGEKKPRMVIFANYHQDLYSKIKNIFRD